MESWCGSARLDCWDNVSFLMELFPQIDIDDVVWVIGSNMDCCIR